MILTSASASVKEGSASRPLLGLTVRNHLTPMTINIIVPSADILRRLLMGIRPTLQAHIASACPCFVPFSLCAAHIQLHASIHPPTTKTSCIGVVIEPLGCVSVCVVSLVISPLAVVSCTHF